MIWKKPHIRKFFFLKDEIHAFYCIQIHNIHTVTPILFWYKEQSIWVFHTFVTKSGATVLTWNIVIIASGVTVLMLVENPMAALLIKQLSPEFPTIDWTCSEAELMLCSLLTSGMNGNMNVQFTIFCKNVFDTRSLYWTVIWQETRLERGACRRTTMSRTIVFTHGWPPSTNTI